MIVSLSTHMIARFRDFSRPGFAAALFDMNGLLINSEDLLLNAKRVFLKSKGVSWKVSYHLDSKGLPVRDYVAVWKRIFHLEDNLNELAREFETITERMVYHSRNLKMLAGVRDFLKWLSNYPIRCALVTTAEKRVAIAVLRRFRLLKYFQAFITADELGGKAGKPSPYCYEMAARQLNVLPKQCVVFEDSINGALAAKSARMACVAVNRSPSRKLCAIADICVKSFEDAKIRNFLLASMHLSALYIGRFQPFHRGHLACVKRVLSQNKKIIIGVQNTGLNKKNPLTFNERRQIIVASLKDAGIAASEYRVIKIPKVNQDWPRQLNRIFDFDVLYAGNPLLKQPFRKSNCKICHLFRGQSPYSGTQIRKKFAAGKSIAKFVMPSAVPLIERFLKKNN